jgi:hypothetical protein
MPPGARVVERATQSRFDLFYADFFDELPVWRFRFDDASDVYVSPTTGSVLARARPVYRWNRVAFALLHTWDVWPGHSGVTDVALGVGALALFASGASGLALYVGRRRR